MRFTAVRSPNKPRPEDLLLLEVADMLRRIEINYQREGSGPGSQFEGRLLEDVQAEHVIRHLRVISITGACDTGQHFDCPGCACTCHPGTSYPAPRHA